MSLKTSDQSVWWENCTSLPTKVLSNRLKKVMGKVVSLSQNAFVEGRQILDVALRVNEAIDSMLKRNESGVLCKLDIEKVYDHINWNFLLVVMQKIGFREKWTSWIKSVYQLRRSLF